MLSLRTVQLRIKLTRADKGNTMIGIEQYSSCRIIKWGYLKIFLKTDNKFKLLLTNTPPTQLLFIKLHKQNEGIFSYVTAPALEMCKLVIEYLLGTFGVNLIYDEVIKLHIYLMNQHTA